MKKFLSLSLAFVLLLTNLFCLTAYAEELRYFERGVLTDGTNTAYYVIDKDNKVLYITGDGNNNAYTPNYPDAASGPFAGRTDITRIVIEEDVAKVGDYALSNLTKVDTLEVQSNLLSSSSSMSSKAMIGCTGLRHIQGDSSLLSTDVFLEVVKGAVNIASGNWLSLISNGISIIGTGVSGDGSLDNDTIHCMVDDYINNGNKIFLGDLDEAKAAYNERLANPCYSNNAFHHDYFDYVSKQPTCTEEGETTYLCNTCGDTYKMPIDALGHQYADSVLYQPSCFTEGITKHSCVRCGSASYEAIPAYGHHSYDSYSYDEEQDAYTEICSVCDNHNTVFDNDTEALISAVGIAKALDSADYEESSFNALDNACARYYDLKSGDYLQYPQVKVDEKTTEILTKISELQPYVKLHLIAAPGGTLEVRYGDTVKNTGINYLLVDTEVSLKAIPSGENTFVGWYDMTDRKYISTAEEFTLTVGSNTTLKAVFNETEKATLTFVSEGNQEYAKYSKTASEWASVTSLEALVPRTPYSYFAENIAWFYDEAEVLSKLRSGESVTVTTTSAPLERVLPQKPVSDGSVPALTLTNDFDSAAGEHILIMATDIPDTSRVQEFGLLLYYKKKDTGFEPSSVAVTVNKRTSSSLYDAFSDDGCYVTELSPNFLAYNIAVKGYINYYGEDGKLRTYYTNQINIKN